MLMAEVRDPRDLSLTELRARRAALQIETSLGQPAHV
jgi:hypothetical protein